MNPDTFAKSLAWLVVITGGLMALAVALLIIKMILVMF